MRELGLAGVIRGLVGSSPSVRTRTVLETSLSRPKWNRTSGETTCFDQEGTNSDGSLPSRL